MRGASTVLAGVGNLAPRVGAKYSFTALLLGHYQWVKNPSLYFLSHSDGGDGVNFDLR
jgi:hypothetical protein